jgi:FMN phosphatase YigB (HAD superfamily)
VSKQTILFFDLDSTLIENQFSGRAIRQLLDEIAAASGKSREALGQELAERNRQRQADNPDHPRTMDWNDIMHEIAREYNVQLSSTVDALWRQYASADDVNVLDNAPQVLDELQEGRRLVLATKGLSKYQKPVLDVTGLGDYFDDILTPDKTGYLKTSPGYFAPYRGRDDALFIQIGDHYVDDVICARRNGFYPVLRAPIDDLRPYAPFERPQHLPDHADDVPHFPDETDIRPEAVVVSLQELPAVVRRLEARYADESGK